MKTLAYIRVSTSKQNPKRQETNISNYATSQGIELSKTYEEKFTGTTEDRPEYKKLKAAVSRYIAKGEEVTIIFDSVSRMSRNADEGIKQYFDWYDMGVNLVFLNEPYISTQTYKSNLPSLPKTDSKFDKVLEAIEEYMRDLASDQIRQAFAQAEKEASDIKKRVSDGLDGLETKIDEITGKEKRVGKSGKFSGRQTGTHFTTDKELKAKEIIKTHCKAFGGTLKDAEVMKLAEVSRDSYYRYKRELLAKA